MKRAADKIRHAIEDALLEEGVSPEGVEQAQAAALEAIKVYVQPPPGNIGDLRARIWEEFPGAWITTTTWGDGTSITEEHAVEVRVSGGAGRKWYAKERSIAMLWREYRERGRKELEAK